MDSIFGIGPLELVAILIIAGIVMGPQRIAQTARWLGKTTAELQKFSRGFTQQLQNELDGVDESGDIREAWREVRNLQKEVSQLRREVISVGQISQEALQEGRDALENTIGTPQTKPTAEVKNTANGRDTAMPLPNLIDIPEDRE